MTHDFEKNRPNLSKQEIEKLIQSRQAQELLMLLQKDGGAAVRQAAQAAVKGDYAKVRELLAPKLASEEARHLLKQLDDPNG